MDSGKVFDRENVLPQDAGEYSVEVANRHGTVVAGTAKLRVIAPILRVYHADGVRLMFEARKGIRYTIEYPLSLLRKRTIPVKVKLPD